MTKFVPIIRIALHIRMIFKVAFMLLNSDYFNSKLWVWLLSTRNKGIQQNEYKNVTPKGT